MPYEEKLESEVTSITNLEVVELGCDMVNVSFSDKILSQEMGACYLVERKYRMINWCEFDGEGSPWVLRSADDKGGAYRVEVDYQWPAESLSEENQHAVYFLDDGGNLVDSIALGEYAEGLMDQHAFIDTLEEADAEFARGFFEYTQKIEVYD